MAKRLVGKSNILAAPMITAEAYRKGIESGQLAPIRKLGISQDLVEIGE